MSLAFINKINGIDFNPSDDRHMIGDIYEKLLAQIAETRGKLKAQLMEALMR
jgi:type I restriction-modification system DNA methylase subunit